jgi:hypothetical protein
MGDAFDPLPAELAKTLRAFDEGLRKELRVLGLVLIVVGTGVGGFIFQYTVRLGRALAPRDEEWIPLLVSVCAIVGGVLLRRLSKTGVFTRAMALRRHEVTDVRLEQRRRRYGFSLWLVFVLPDTSTLGCPIGDGLDPSSPRAQQLLSEARLACRK